MGDKDTFRGVRKGHTDWKGGLEDVSVPEGDTVRRRWRSAEDFSSGRSQTTQRARRSRRATASSRLRTKTTRSTSLSGVECQGRRGSVPPTRGRSPQWGSLGYRPVPGREVGGLKERDGPRRGSRALPVRGRQTRRVDVRGEGEWAGETKI